MYATRVGMFCKGHSKFIEVVADAAMMVAVLVVTLIGMQCDEFELKFCWLRGQSL
jgi:hypothetical protein